MSIENQEKEACIMENTSESKNPIQVADRLFLVLETLTMEGAMGLQDLSTKLTLNKSTVHRILNSLIYMGYVKQDNITLKYRPSMKIWELANQVITKLDIVEIARPFIKELVASIEETVHLVELDGSHAVYIDKVESYTNTIRMASNVGKSIPLYCSGVGKAMLAYMDDSDIEKIWNDSTISPHTEHTITDFTCFMNEIKLIRKLGYALDNEENEKGVRCIAVSLSSKDRNSRYAFSISAPINRMSDERIAILSKYVLDTKEKLQASI